jgi:hypothetical protein
MMSVKLGTTLAALSVAMLLTGCGGGRKGAFDRARPNEFAVQRNAPLVVPPDFALVPPRPGAPRPQEIDSQGQAMQALFGGRAADTTVGTTVLNQAGDRDVDPAARSTAGDPQTTVVDKGGTTRDIIAAPEGPGQGATASTPQ